MLSINITIALFAIVTKPARLHYVLAMFEHCIRAGVVSESGLTSEQEKHKNRADKYSFSHE